MISFTDKLKAIKVRLENNQALQDFCLQQFNKPLKVKRLYKTPDEVALTEVPLIFITRPSVQREWQGAVSGKKNTVSVYGIFHWTDESDAGLEAAADLLIEFEELIEAAAGAHTKIDGDQPMAVMPGNSANDEGMHHPLFCVNVDFIVKTK